MKILFLTPQLPYPPQQGTTIRNYNLIKNLAPRHEIHLLSFVQSKDELDRAEPLLTRCQHVEVVPTPQRSPLKRALSVLFSPQPDMALRLPSAEFRAKLEAYLRGERFDVVQVEGIEMAQYGLWPMAYGRWRMADSHKLSAISYQPLAVFDAHNAEYVLQRRAFETDVRQPGHWIGALYSFIQWHKLRRYEAKTCRRFDKVVAVSEADAQALQRLVPNLEVTVVPHGVDTIFYHPTFTHHSSLITHHSLVFTGKMDFRPNIDAVLWFCHEVWPLVQSVVPDVHFYIVGQNPDRRVISLGDDPHVTVTGYVEDVRPYIAGAAVYVVPLRIGGGMRLKVLEAMAMGQAILSTSLGCEGIDLTPGQELVIADTAEEFAQRVVELLGDAGRRQRLGQAARRLVEASYDWRLIVPKLEAVYGG